MGLDVESKQTIDEAIDRLKVQVVEHAADQLAQIVIPAAQAAGQQILADADRYLTAQRQALFADAGKFRDESLLAIRGIVREVIAEELAKLTELKIGFVK